MIYFTCSYFAAGAKISFFNVKSVSHAFAIVTVVDRNDDRPLAKCSSEIVGKSLIAYSSQHAQYVLKQLFHF